jgi:hypothetical protein
MFGLARFHHIIAGRLVRSKDAGQEPSRPVDADASHIILRQSHPQELKRT